MPKTSSDSAARPGAALQRVHLHGPTMGTRWSVSCDLPPAAATTARTDALRQALAAAVAEVDAQMSPWQPGSDLNRFNRAAAGAWVALPAALLQVLGHALQVGRASGGAFDPGVGALVDAWGFGAARDTPDAHAIRLAAQAARVPAHELIELDGAQGRARKLAPVQLDLCGIAKGYGVDRLVQVLQQHGVAHALAALDGELRALGAQGDGRPWAVAIESPTPGRRSTHGVIELQDLAVATSGDYRRFLDVGGVRVAHTMDARRGAPVRNELASVTVLAPEAMGADAWATALLVAGPGPALALAQQAGLDALLLLRREGRWVELGLGRFASPAAA